MIAVLEEAKVREWVCPISVEDYHNLHSGNKHTELIQGVVFNKIPKSPLHANTIRLLLRFFNRFIKDDCEMVSENPITLTDSELEPDIFITSPLHSLHEGHPTKAYLVIEISVTSMEYDRTKAQVYSRGAIPVYWNILPLEKITVVYSEPTAEGYKSVKQIPFSEELTISLPKQKLTVKLEDILK